MRALVVDIADGRGNRHRTCAIIASGDAGVLLDRERPESRAAEPGRLHRRLLRQSVSAAPSARRRAKRGFEPENVVGIGVDTTGSTPIPGRRRRHGARAARRVQERARRAGLAVERSHGARRGGGDHRARPATDGYPYLAKCGGTYSSRVVLVEDSALRARRRRTWPRRPRRGSSWPTFVPAYITGNVEPAHDGARHLRGRAQGDVPRRVGRPAERRVSRLARTGACRGSATRPRPCRRTTWPGKLTAEVARRSACPRAFRWPSARSMRTWARSARAAARARW